MKKFLAFILALACALSLMACGKKNNDDKPDHARAPVRATHEQIARDTGAVRETVTRMLRHFADDGIVSLGRGTVTVTDAEKLRKLAGM